MGLPSPGDLSHAIFVSYSRADEAVALRVVKTLEDAGLKCWIYLRDNRSAEPDHHYATGIAKAIKACKLFLVVGTPSANGSVPIKKEADIANQNHKRLLWVTVDAEPDEGLEYYFQGGPWPPFKRDKVSDRDDAQLIPFLRGEDALKGVFRGSEDSSRSDDAVSTASAETEGSDGVGLLVIGLAIVVGLAVWVARDRDPSAQRESGSRHKTTYDSDIKPKADDPETRAETETNANARSDTDLAEAPEPKKEGPAEKIEASAPESLQPKRSAPPAEEPRVERIATLGGPEFDSVLVRTDPFGDLVVAGSKSRAGMTLSGETIDLGSASHFIAKLQMPSLEPVWVQTLQLNGAITDVACDSKNSIAVTGSFRGQTVFCGEESAASPAYGGSTGFVAHLSADVGHVDWLVGIGGDGYDHVSATAFRPFGGLLIAGKIGSDGALLGETEFISTETGDADAFVGELNRDSGEFVWSRFIGGNGHDDATSLATDPDGRRGGNVMVVGGRLGGGELSLDGFERPLSNQGEGFVAYFDVNSKKVKWVETMPGAFVDGVAIDRTGNVVGSGSIYGTSRVGGLQRASRGQADAIVFKLAGSTGSALWVSSFGGSGSERAGPLALGDQGEVLFCGSLQGSKVRLGQDSYSNSGSSPDGFLAALDGHAGTVVWSTALQGKEPVLSWADPVPMDDSILWPVVFQGEARLEGSLIESVGAGDVALAHITPPMSQPGLLSTTDVVYDPGTRLEWNRNPYVLGLTKDLFEQAFSAPAYSGDALSPLNTKLAKLNESLENPWRVATTRDVLSLDRWAKSTVFGAFIQHQISGGARNVIGIYGDGGHLSSWGVQHANYLQGPYLGRTGGLTISDYGVWLVRSRDDAPEGAEALTTRPEPITKASIPLRTMTVDAGPSASPSATAFRLEPDCVQKAVFPLAALQNATLVRAVLELRASTSATPPPLVQITASGSGSTKAVGRWRRLGGRLRVDLTDFAISSARGELEVTFLLDSNEGSATVELEEDLVLHLDFVKMEDRL